MNVTLKSYKENKNLSEETRAFTATIYIDGKKAGTVSNHGIGGCNEYRFADRGLEEAFHKFCESQPPIPWDLTVVPDVPKSAPEGLPMDADLFVSGLCDKIAKEKQIKRWTKTKVVFRLDGAVEGEYLTITHGGKSADTARFVRDKYGDQIVELYA